MNKSNEFSVAENEPQPKKNSERAKPTTMVIKNFEKVTID